MPEAGNRKMDFAQKQIQQVMVCGLFYPYHGECQKQYIPDR